MFGFSFIREWRMRRHVINEAHVLGEAHQTALADSVRSPLVLAEAAIAADDSIAASAYWEEAKFKLSPASLESEKTVKILIGLERLGELQDFLNRWPNQPLRWLGLARLNEARSDYKEALQWWSLLRQRSPAEISGYFGEARCLEKLGNSDEIVKVFQIAIQHHASDKDCWLRLAKSAEDAQKFEDALSYWKHVATELNLPQGYAGASRVYRLLGAQDEAQHWLTLGSRKYPSNSDLLIESAEAFEEKGLWEHAATGWQLLRQVYPNRRLGYKREIRCLLQMNRKTEAALLQHEEETRFDNKDKNP